MVASETVDAALQRRSLSPEQTGMVRRLTSSGAGVEVVVGKAGTGKTYALDAAREAWEESGLRVSGVALAARAALELQTSASIRSTTLARLLGQLDDHRDGSPLEPGSVLVVDPAVTMQVYAPPSTATTRPPPKPPQQPSSETDRPDPPK